MSIFVTGGAEQDDAMSDIGANLLMWAQNEEMVDGRYTAHGRDCLAAADEIERLRARIAQLEAALKEGK